MEKKTREEMMVEVVNKAIEMCKKASPGKYADAPQATKYNITEIYEYMRG